MTDEKSRVISAVSLASVSNVSNLTCDRIEALAGGHGMVNIAIHSVANVIAGELLKGEKLTIEFADVRRLPVADIMEKAIGAAKKSGADGANAALSCRIRRPGRHSCRQQETGRHCAYAGRR